MIVHRKIKKNVSGSKDFLDELKLSAENIGMNWHKCKVIIYAAAETCKMSPEKLIGGLDYNISDTKKENLDAVFAMLRAINQFALWGFTNVSPIESGKSHADFKLELKGCPYIVEVRNSSKDAQRSIGDLANYKYNNNSYEFYKYYTNVFKEKRQQLESSSIETKISKKIFLVVVDSLPLVRFENKDTLLEFLGRIYKELELDSNWHLALMTGFCDHKGEPDSCIYPPVSLTIVGGDDASANAHKQIPACAGTAGGESGSIP